MSIRCPLVKYEEYILEININVRLELKATAETAE